MIDLRSDTKTRPTDAMRSAMASAEVGDEQAGEDPTCLELERRVAELLGKEDALFLVSGTMANNVAIASHTQRGDAIIADRRSHILRSETGGAAVGSGVLIDQVDGDRGHFTAAQLAEQLQPGTRYRPPTTLVCLEQTHNFAGGTVWPFDQWREVSACAHERGAAVLADGARLLNAVVASQVAARDWCSHVDSAWIDFTKGLGAPLGAVLAGTSAFCERARRNKHLFGAALRQAGIVAAGCLYALDHHVDRLAIDHAHAAHLADGLEDLGYLVERPVETNMVYVRAPGEVAAADFIAALGRHAVAAGEVLGRVRLVTHLDVSSADIETAIDAFRDVLVELTSTT